jgi:hypothetical protein
MKNEIQKSLHQAQKIRAAAIPENYIKQQITQAAVIRSLAGDILARIGECEEAVLKLLDLLYEKDSDGVFANVDSQTGKILRPLPWGQAGYKKWGLRDLSATVLRAWFMKRSTKSNDLVLPMPRPTLFIYNQSDRRWYLNTQDYGTKELAWRFLEKEKLTVKEWRALAYVKQANNRRYHQKRKSASLPRGKK